MDDQFHIKPAADYNGRIQAVATPITAPKSMLDDLRKRFENQFTMNDIDVLISKLSSDEAIVIGEPLRLSFEVSNFLMISRLVSD